MGFSQVPKEIITAESLIRIFDKDGSGDVDYEEMVRGIQRLKHVSARQTRAKGFYL